MALARWAAPEEASQEAPPGPPPSYKLEVVCAECRDGRILYCQHVAERIGDDDRTADLLHCRLHRFEVGEHGHRELDEVLIAGRVTEALDGVVAEAVVEDECVVAGASVEGVVPAASDQRIVAGIGADLVVAVSAFQDVTAAATLELVVSGTADERAGEVAGLAIEIARTDVDKVLDVRRRVQIETRQRRVDCIGA